MPFGRNLGDAVINIQANVANFQAGMQRVSTRMNAFSAGATRMQTGLNQISTAALRMGAALSAVFVPATIEGAKFEQQMASVKAVMNDLQAETEQSTRNFEVLTAKALELGRTTQFTAVQVGEALQYLGLAGFTADEALQGIEDTLDLAAAGMLDLGRASDLATDTMTAFSIEAEDLQRVVDVFAQTATNSNTSVEQLGEAMKLVAPSSAALGQSIEQTSTALGILANAGLKGSVSGAGLAQAFTQLAKKGEDANDVLMKYGLTIEDVHPDLVSIRDIVAQFESVNLSAGDAMDLFGARAGRMILALKQQGVAAFDELQATIEGAAGAAKRMAGIRMDTTIGDFKKLDAAVKGLAIQAFEAFKESLRGTIITLVEIVTKITDWVEKNKEFVGQMAKLIAVLAGGLIVLSGVAAAFAALAGAIAGFIAIGSQALILGAAIIAGVVTQVGLIATFLSPIFIALAQNWQKFLDVLKAGYENIIKPFMDGFMRGFADAWTGLVKPAMEQLSKGVGLLLDALKELFESMGFAEQAQFSFGYVLGTILPAAMTMLITMLRMVIGAMRIMIKTATLASSAMGGLINLAGMFIEGTEDDAAASAAAAAAAAAHAQAVADLTTQLNANADAAKNRTNNQRAQNAEDIKALHLLERFDKLSIVEAKRLAELTANGAANINNIKNRIALAKQDEAILEANLQKSKQLTGSEDVRTKAQLERTKAQRAEDERTLERLEAINKIRTGGTAELDRQRNALKANGAAMKTRIDQLLNEIEILQDSGQAATDKREELDNLLQSQKENNEELANLNSMNRENVDLMASVNGNEEEYAKKLDERRKITEDANKATENLAGTEKKFRDLQDDLGQKTLTGIEEELKAIEDLRIERENLLAQRKADLKAALVGLKLREQQIASLEDQTLATRRLAQAQKERADLEQGLKEVEAAEQQNADDARDKSEAARQKQADKRKNFLRDQKIKQLKDSGKFVEAQKLENQKIVEEEKKKNDELFALDGKNDAQIMAERKKAEEGQALEAKKRMDKAKGQKSKATGQTQMKKDEVKLEQKLTDKLAERVTNVRQLLQLYRALWELRRQQEQRAIAQAAEVDRREAALAKKKQQRANEQDPAVAARLDADIARMERRLELERQFEGKRAAEAGVDPAQQAANQSAQQTAAQLAQQAAMIQQMVADIQQMGTDTQILFANMPSQWVDAFVGGWKTEGQRMVNEVRNTVKQVKNELNPATKHSPSLIDIMNSNVSTIRRGVASMDAAVKERMPNMGQLNFAQARAIQPVGLPTSKFASSGGSKELNDNRTVHMDIHNNTDIDNVKRQIARALNNANMGRAGEI